MGFLGQKYFRKKHKYDLNLMIFTFCFMRRSFTNYNVICDYLWSKIERSLRVGTLENIVLPPSEEFSRLQLRGRECRRRIFSGPSKGTAEGYCYHTISSRHVPLSSFCNIDYRTFRSGTLNYTMKLENVIHRLVITYGAVHRHFSKKISWKILIVWWPLRQFGATVIYLNYF